MREGIYGNINKDGLTVLILIQQKQYQSIRYACGCAAGDDRACDGEHFHAGAQNYAFGLEFDSGRRNCIGKACYWHKCARPCLIGNFMVHAQSCHKHAEKHHCDRHSRRYRLLAQTLRKIKIPENLADKTDKSTDKKCPHTVLYDV